MSDWRVEVARAEIPAWVGMLADEKDRSGGVVYAVSPKRVGIVTSMGLRSEVDYRSVVPRLTDPDTLAAFDRRLALRLGAPERLVREGVTFHLVESDGWVIGAGGEMLVERQWELVFCGRVSPKNPGWRAELGTDDTLLARVRAWKSVPG